MHETNMEIGIQFFLLELLNTCTMIRIAYIAARYGYGD